MADASPTPSAVVFILDNLPDAENLVAAAPEGAQIVWLDAQGDALAQMAAWLEGRSGIDALHVFTHGNAGKLQLGSQWLDSGNIAANRGLLATIGSALNENGDIFLYGCNVAEDEAGLEFVRMLADATGADVAASNDLTGAAGRKGDWDLEFRHGDIESAALVPVDFSGLLAAFSDDMNNSGGNGASFVRTLGGVSYTYTFTTQGDGGDLAYESLYGSGNSASMSLMSSTANLATTERMTITRTDLADFTFTSLYLDNANTETVYVAGYLNGLIVGTAQSVGTGAGTLNFGGILVDEVRITSTDFYGLSIDDFAGDTDPPPTAPSLTATGVDPTFTEGGSAVDLFSAVTASTNDAGEHFSGATLTVTNVSNGASEILTVGGTDIGLTNGNSGTIAGIGSYSVSVAAGTATVSLSGMTRDNAQMASLMDAITYRNTSDNPGSSSRVVTIASISDSGSSNSSAALSQASTVTVTPLDDAPTLTPANNITAYTEGGSATLLSPSITVSDVDSTTFQGATVTISDFRSGDVLSVGNASGFTVGYDTGTGVLTLTGSGNAAALQTALRSITYSSTSDDPTFGGTDGTRQFNFTVTDNGGLASATVTAQVAVTGVNDAPSLSAGPYSWAATGEDTVSTVVTVSSLLGSLSASDADSASLGIAITASSGNGTWQYSTDGNWYSVGPVNSSAALLLSATTELRYVPDAQNGETPTLSVRAWDQTSGSATVGSTRSTADTTTNGGSTSFSSTTAQASLSVSSVNDAPVLTPTGPTLNGLTDTDVHWVGQAVSSFAGANSSDVDSGAIKGIAITGSDAGNGTWQFSTNGGASWQDVGAVADASALLLRSSDRVRFVPDGVNGTNATITYRAWDQSGATSGHQGSKVDASSTGGNTPFSSAIDTASITVTAVNDAPLITTTGGTTAFVEGDNVASTPVAVDAGLTVSDPDSAWLYGATVTITGNFQSAEDVLGFTSNPATMGDITSSYDSATGKLTLSSASGASAAQWQAALRTVTYSNSSDNPVNANRTISFVVSDGAADSLAGNRMVSVSRTNDTPIVTVPSGITVVEDVASTLTGISFSDADAGAGAVTVTLSVPSGTLSATSGGGVTIAGTASAQTLTGSISDINAFIAGGNVSFQAALNSTANVTLTASISDNGLSGGAAASASQTVELTVTAINDAPTITAPATINVAEDIAQTLSGISFSDVDAGTGNVTVTLSAASGTLAANSGGGVTVGGTSSALTLFGSVSNINAFIAGSAVSFTTASNATSNVVLTVSIDDGGHVGAGGSLTDSATVTLTVTAQNDAPVNAVPGTQTVQQDGTLVFSASNGNALSVTDVDADGNPLEVTLTASNGLVTLGGTTGLAFFVGSGAGDATMTFSGSIVDINNALLGLNFTPTAGYHGAASLQITTNDKGYSGAGSDLTDTDTITINVAQASPTITSVASSSANGSYKIGDILYITVTFDQAVNVDTSGGTPTLLLETGTTDRLATYASGSGSSELTFAYVVQAGDQSADLDYTDTVALALNGASIGRTSDATPATTALPTPGAAGSLGANAALVIDGIAPSVSSVAVPADATYTQGQTLQFTVNLDEAVTVDITSGAPRLAIALDTGGTVYAAYAGGSGPTTALDFAMTVAVGQVDLTGISIGALQANGATLRDAAGNDATLTLAGIAPTSGVRINAPAPTPEPEPEPPTPPVTPPPGVPDNDSVPAAIEDQAPGLPGIGGTVVQGDGNGDGIKDSVQAAVASLAMQAEGGGAGAPSSFVTLVAGSLGGKVTGDADSATITRVAHLGAPADAPHGLQMPLGLLSFTAQVGAGHTGEDFSLYVDPALGVNGYWKQDAQGTWVNLASEPYGGKMVMEGGRLRLDFHIDDGGQFDADAQVNGVISDPGAPGHMPLSLVGWAPDTLPGGFWF